MSFEASLTQFSQTKFTNALSCLSRFGEEVHIQALDTELVLSTLNSSKTSYAQFSFYHAFFDSYHAAPLNKGGVKCHLNAKALLGVFKSKGRLEKTAERCELSMYDEEAVRKAKKKDRPKKKRRVRDSDDSSASGSEYEEEEDSSVVTKGPPSRLNIKFHCAHGFVKSHSMFISNAHTLRRPTNSLDNEPDHSYFKVSPKMINEWMEPFPGWNVAPGKGSTGGKLKEGYVAWTFGDAGVKIGTWEVGARADKLATEFMVDSDEFDEFSLAISPVSLGVPMRELKAITFLSSQLQVPLSCGFTTPLQPLFVKLSHHDDVFDVTFTIMPQEVPKASGAAPTPMPVRHSRPDKPRGGGGAESRRKTLHMDAVADAAVDEQDDDEHAEQQAAERSSRSNGKGKGRESDRDETRDRSEPSRTGNSNSSSRRRHADPDEERSSSYRYPDDNNDNFDDGYRSQANIPQPPASRRSVPPQPAASAHSSRPRSRSRLATSRSPSPLARTRIGKPPGEESLFMPNSQEQSNSQDDDFEPAVPSQPRAHASQLSQVQLEGYGLGDLDKMDLDFLDFSDPDKDEAPQADKTAEEEESDEETQDEPIAVKPPRAGERARNMPAKVISKSTSTDMDVEGDGVGDAHGDEDVRVAATLRPNENRFVFDRSHDEDDENDEVEESDNGGDPAKENLPPTPPRPRAEGRRSSDRSARRKTSSPEL